MKKKKNTQSEGSFKVLNMDTICLSCITGQENEKYLNPELITHKKKQKEKSSRPQPGAQIREYNEQ